MHAVAFNASGEEVEGAVSGASWQQQAAAGQPAGVSDSSDSGAAGSSEAVSAASGNDVHSLLLRRIRQLESRLVRADAARNDAEAACAELRARIEAAQDTITDQAALVARLDDALSSRLAAAGASGGADGQRPAAAAAGATSSQTPQRAAAPGGPRLSQLLSPQLQLENLLLGAVVSVPPTAPATTHDRQGGASAAADSPPSRTSAWGDAQAEGSSSNGDMRLQILQVRRETA